MILFSTDIPVLPVAKGRPRVGKFGNVFTPKKTQTAENQIRYIVAQEWKKAPLDIPLNVTVIFYFERPKSVKEHKRPHHTTKPDCSNLVKTLEDGLNGVLWRDDCLITQLQIIKKYRDRPGIFLQVEDLEVPVAVVSVPTKKPSSKKLAEVIADAPNPLSAEDSRAKDQTLPACRGYQGTTALSLRRGHAGRTPDMTGDEIFEHRRPVYSRRRAGNLRTRKRRTRTPLLGD